MWQRIFFLYSAFFRSFGGTKQGLNTAELLTPAPGPLTSTAPLRTHADALALTPAPASPRSPRRSVSHAFGWPHGGHIPICARFVSRVYRSCPLAPTRMHGPATTIKWLRQVGPTTTCSTSYLLCTIKMKHLLHTSRTDETFETYTWNNIATWPTCRSIFGTSRYNTCNV
jgi:hypothetical protein